MDSFNLVRRRTSDLVQNVQQNMPSKMPQMPQMPQIPQLPSFGAARKDSTNGTWQRINATSLPCSSHSLNVISGVAYIFGGETARGELVKNDMHIITLPDITGSSDYLKVPAAPVRRDTTLDESTSQKKEWEDRVKAELREKGLDEVSLDETRETKATPTLEEKGKGKATNEPKSSLGSVPVARSGHVTAVIGSRIFMFGGLGGSEGDNLEEGGRVWIFDTRSRTWSYLDPVPAVPGGAIVPHPSSRSYPCSTSTDKPNEFVKAAPRKAGNWKEWAVGDTTETGIPQDPIVGNVAEKAVDQEDDGYGTFFVHGGFTSSCDQANDLWAFDVRSATWTELPAAPGPGRGGAAICVSKSRLFRFGGFDGKVLGGQLDFLHLSVNTFDDSVSRGEIALRARGGWQSIIQSNADASTDEIVADASQAWPPPRSMSSLIPLNLGGGREFLVLAMGEAEPAPSHDEPGKFHSDVWTFQPPPQGMSAASFKDAMLQAVGRKTSEGKWTKVDMRPHDDDNSDEMPKSRGWFASAPLGDLDERGIVLWGGLGEDSKERLGDGWILRID